MPTDRASRLPVTHVVSPGEPGRGRLALLGRVSPPGPAKRPVHPLAPLSELLVLQSLLELAPSRVLVEGLAATLRPADLLRARQDIVRMATSIGASQRRGEAFCALLVRYGAPVVYAAHQLGALPVRIERGEPPCLGHLEQVAWAVGGSRIADPMVFAWRQRHLLASGRKAARQDPEHVAAAVLQVSHCVFTAMREAGEAWPERVTYADLSGLPPAASTRARAEGAAWRQGYELDYRSGALWRDKFLQSFVDAFAEKALRDMRQEDGWG